MEEVSININLVGAMIQIIDRSAQAGVFAGQDLSTVGRIRDDLVRIFESNQPQRPNGPLADKVVN